MRAVVLALVLLLAAVGAGPLAAPAAANHICTLPTEACDDPPFGIRLLCKVAPQLFNCRR